VILVVGGSGFIGAAAVRRLVHGKADVGVMTAHPKRSRTRIEALGARAIAGDVLDPPSLAPAVRGAETIIQALTFPTFPVEKKSSNFTFEEFEHLGTERLVSAAAAAGVAKFVYVSGSGAAGDATKVWFRAKWGGEEAVRASGLDHCILRPSWAYGPEDRALNRFAGLARWLPFVPVIGDGLQWLQPVFIDDVGEALARGAKPGGPSGTFEIGGPDVLTMNEVLVSMLEALGRPRKRLVHFPAALPKLAGFFLQILPKPPLSPDAVDFLTGDAVADTGPLLEAFDLTLMPLAEGLATYLRR
jgi:uncharacterized protein YbjT (DUF2867 family)